MYVWICILYIVQATCAVHAVCCVLQHKLFFIFWKTKLYVFLCSCKSNILCKLCAITILLPVRSFNKLCIMCLPCFRRVHAMHHIYSCIPECYTLCTHFFSNILKFIYCMYYTLSMDTNRIHTGSNSIDSFNIRKVVSIDCHFRCLVRRAGNWPIKRACKGCSYLCEKFEWCNFERLYTFIYIYI